MPKPLTPGLHAMVTNFGMTVELAWVLADQRHYAVTFRRNLADMQHDTPETVAAKLRRLADAIEKGPAS